MTDAQTMSAKLIDHLRDVSGSPTTPLDTRLLEECETFLVPQLARQPEQLLELIGLSSRLLPSLQQDPTPLTRLLQRLVEPFSFAQVLQLDPPVDFVAGLDVRALPYNGLLLSLVQKAAKSPKDAAFLANIPDIMFNLVKLWLTTPDSGIADKAGEVLMELLLIDMESGETTVHGIGDSRSGGLGLIWRRMFGDKNVYRLLFSTTSLASQEHPELGKKEKTLAQARLMSILPRLGTLDWNYINTSHHPDIEQEFGLDPARQGLVDWAADKMVDTNDDVLMYLNLLQFYSDLLSHARLASPTDRYSSVSLDFLVSRGLHSKAISFWASPDDPSHDPLAASFLYGQSARYVSTFLSEYPEAFLNSQLQTPVLQRLSQALDISAGQWAHGKSPANDLHVLSSIPRISLLPSRALGTGRRSSPLFIVPVRVTNADALMALAHVFRGPQDHFESLTPAEKERYANEAAAARALYTLFVGYHDTMYAHLLQHANTVAFPQQALAAIALIMAIASANWAPLPAVSRFDRSRAPDALDLLPSDDALEALLPEPPAVRVADQGIKALLQSPARERVFTWLLQPPASYTHLVGGRGDPESSAYKIAMAKWDLLQVVSQKMRALAIHGEERNVPGLASLQQSLAARMAEGPWGSALEAGSRIGTLEL